MKYSNILLAMMAINMVAYADIDHTAMQRPVSTTPISALPKATQINITQAPMVSVNTNMGATHANSTTFLEQHHNRLVAQWSLQQVNASLRQLSDPWVVESIYRTTATLNSLARSQPLLATPVILDNNINAFAVPGGLIAINTGVVESAKTFDEVASVLAHEVAHLSLRHYERKQDDKAKLLALQLGGLAAAIAASAVSGDAAAAMMIGSQTMSAENAAAFSRSHEKEADRVGMNLLAQAGFDVYAMPQFFEGLQKQVNLNSTKDAFVPSFVQTHPFTLDRLSEATSRAATYPKQSVLQDDKALEFDLLKWRIRYLARTTSQSELKQASKSSLGANLAYVATLADNRQFDEADKLMQSILATLNSAQKEHPLVCITQGHIAYEQGDFAKAVQFLTPCQAIYPERRDLVVYLADSLIYANQSAKARNLLLPLLEKSPHDTLVSQLLQTSYEKDAMNLTGKAKDIMTAKALQARANKELWTAKYDKALSSLTQAKTLVKDDPILTKTLDDELATVRLYKDFKL